MGRLIAKAEHLGSSAKKKGDLALCWKIEVDLIDRLMALKILDSKPDAPKIEVNINADPGILEAEIAEDLTLLERIKARGGEVIDVEAKEVGGNGTTRHAGGNGSSQASSENGDQSENPNSTGGAE